MYTVKINSVLGACFHVINGKTPIIEISNFLYLNYKVKGIAYNLTITKGVI